MSGYTVHAKVLGIAAAMSLVGVQAHAEKLILAHGFIANHFWTTKIIEPWMACVKEGTKDAVEFDYFPGGQIVKTTDSLDAMNNGLTHVSSISIGYVSDQMPLSGISMLPNMGETSVEAAAAYRKMVEDGTMFAEELKQNEVHMLVANLFPPYQLITLGGPITKLEDLQSKVIRSSGGALTFALSALGAAPAEMPSSELYVAMQRGTVDGALSALSSVKPYNLQELVKGISTNGRFGSFATLLAIDLDTYNGLAPEVQTVLDSCGAQVEQSVNAFLDEENEQLKAEFAGLGIEVYEFPAEMDAKMVDLLAPVAQQYIDRVAARGLPAQEVYDQYKAALGQ